MQKYINNPKQGFLQKVAIKKTPCHRSSFLLFETVVSCSDPEQIFIKQVVLFWKSYGSEPSMVILVLSNKISQTKTCKMHVTQI